MESGQALKFLDVARRFSRKVLASSGPFLALVLAAAMVITPDAAAADDARGDGDAAHAPEGEGASDREPSPPLELTGDLDAPRPTMLLRGGGWGHSVGMSQYGARAQALAGRPYAEILEHYYPGTQLSSASVDGSYRVGLLNPRPKGSGDRRFDFDHLEAYAETGEVTWERCSPSDGCEGLAEQPAEATWRVERSDGKVRLRNEAGDVVPPDDEDDEDGAPSVSAQSDQSEQFLRVRLAGDVVQLPQLSGNTGQEGRSYRHGELQVRPSLRDEGHVMASVVLPDLDTYLYGLAEVPFVWPADALKAQAVAGRTFAARAASSFSEGCACHITDGPDTQVYRGYDRERSAGGDAWRDAVDGTSGEAVTYEGRLIEAYYSSSHHGRSENSEDSWAFTGTLPYLRSVDDSWSRSEAAGNPNRSWTAEAAHDDLAGIVAPDLEVVTRVEVVDRTDGGTPRTLQLTGLDEDGQRRQVEYAGSATHAVASSVLRQRLPVGQGGLGGRLRSQQLDRIGFAPFTDDLGGVHEYAAVVLAEEGITRGLSATRFGPSESVSRVQMAEFLGRALDLDPVVEDGPFSDVGQLPAARRGMINAIAEEGISLGYAGTDEYRPFRDVTRAEMASFLARAFDVDKTEQGPFADLGGTSHAASINGIAAAGITRGCADDRYCPDDDVRRGEMATFIVRSLGLPL